MANFGTQPSGGSTHLMLRNTPIQKVRIKGEFWSVNIYTYEVLTMNGLYERVIVCFVHCAIAASSQFKLKYDLCIRQYDRKAILLWHHIWKLFLLKTQTWVVSTKLPDPQKTTARNPANVKKDLPVPVTADHKAVDLSLIVNHLTKEF